MCAPYFVNLNNTFQLKRYYSLFIYVHSKREQKSHLQLFVWGISSSCEICRVQRCDWGWFSGLCTMSSTASTFSAVRVVCGRPLPGARSMDPAVRNRFWKSSTPCLLHFLLGNYLINRFTQYFFDSQTFFINVLSSFVNILSFWATVCKKVRPMLSVH